MSYKPRRIKEFLTVKAVKFYMTVALLFFLPLNTPSLSVAEMASDADLLYKVEIASFKTNEKTENQLLVIHPYFFDLRTIQTSMGLLVYQDRILVWSGKKRVFKNSSIRIMAPIIRKKIAQSNSDQRVVFKIFNSSGRTLTQGDVFLTPQGLHWRFRIIDETRRGADDFNLLGDPWRLVLGKRQAYKKRRTEGLIDKVRNVTNWVVLQEVRPMPPRILIDPRLPSSVPAFLSDPSEMEEKPLFEFPSPPADEEDGPLFKFPSPPFAKQKEKPSVSSFFPAVIVPGTPSAIYSAPESNKRDEPFTETLAAKIIRRLRILDELKEADVITEKEYRNKRKEILASF